MAAIVAATLLLNACSSWSRVDVASGGVEPLNGERVRVTRHDGTTLLLWNAGIATDTLIGDARVPPDPQTATADEWSRGYRLQNTKVPFAAIARVEHREGSVPKTIFAVLGAVAVAYVLAFAAWLLS